MPGLPSFPRQVAAFVLLALPLLLAPPLVSSYAEDGRLSNEQMKAAEEEFARLFAQPGNGPGKKDILERLVSDGTARALKMLSEALFKQVEVWWEMRKELDALATEHAQILARGIKGFNAADEKRVHDIQGLMKELDESVVREAENLVIAQDATARAPAALRLNLLRRARASKDWTVRAAAARVAAVTREDKDSWDFISRTLVSDPDGRVRMAILDALASSATAPGEEDAPPDRGEDLVLGALGDADWGVQLRAIQILRDRKVERSVPHMINMLSKCTPRVAESVAEALREFTGEQFGPYYEQWGKWWDDNKDSYKEKVNLSSAKREEFTESHFYGIPIKSDRILFVIDVSGSMKLPTENDNPKERWKPAPPTTGGGNAPPPPPPPEEVLSGSKLDVAKHELKKAIEKLPPQTTFNIVCFNQAVSSWQAKQMPASKKNKEDAYQWIRALEPHGSTYIDGALRLAFRLAGLAVADDKYPEIAVDTMMVLSDGAPTDNSFPTSKLMDIEEILQHVREWNRHQRVVVHAIGISKHDGIEFMMRLAKENGGVYVDR